MNAEQHMCNIEKDTGGIQEIQASSKLNQTCFVESSLLMRHGFWVRPRNQAPEMSMEVSDVAEAEESKTVKIKSQSHVDHFLRCQRHRPQWVLATGPDDQSASLQRDPVAFVSLSAREVTRVTVAGSIVAASRRQCTCSQRPEHPAVPGREEHRRTGTTSLFTWSCSVWFFFFFPSSRGSSSGPVLWACGPSRGL